MQSSVYVGLSAQIALRMRLETIAHNVANASTAGFRADHVRFDTLVARAGGKSVAFADTGETFISRAAGGLVKTGNPLDVAVMGQGFLAFQGPNGPVYTRDGRMLMTPSGALVTVDGYPVLDAGGSALLLDAAGGPPVITRDGMVAQGGRQVGALGLFEIAADAKLTRFENSGVIPDQAATPVLQFQSDGVVQGMIENANVNPIEEISRLIAVQRDFEGVTGALNQTEASLSQAIRTLGGAS